MSHQPRDARKEDIAEFKIGVHDRIGEPLASLRYDGYASKVSSSKIFYIIVCTTYLFFSLPTKCRKIFFFFLLVISAKRETSVPHIMKTYQLVRTSRSINRGKIQRKVSQPRVNKFFSSIFYILDEKYIDSLLVSTDEVRNSFLSSYEGYLKQCSPAKSRSV